MLVSLNNTRHWTIDVDSAAGIWTGLQAETKALHIGRFFLSSFLFVIIANVVIIVTIIIIISIVTIIAVVVKAYA